MAGTAHGAEVEDASPTRTASRELVKGIDEANGTLLRHVFHQPQAPSELATSQICSQGLEMRLHLGAATSASASIAGYPRKPLVYRQRNRPISLSTRAIHVSKLSLKHRNFCCPAFVL